MKIEENIIDEIKVKDSFSQEEVDKIISKRIEKVKYKSAQVKQEELDLLTEQINKLEMEIQVLRELTYRNLPIEFSEFLLGKTIEESMENIKVFEESFTESVQTRVEKRLKGGYVPPTSR